MLTKTKRTATTKTATTMRRLEPSPTRVGMDADTGTGDGPRNATPRSVGARRRAGRRVGAAIALAAITLVAVVVATTTAEPELELGERAPRAVPVSDPAVGSQEFLARLADQGYIPREAVDRRLLLLERAIARRDIPAATLGQRSGAPEPRYTPQELLLIEAVTTGQVPRDALDADLLGRAADDGRIPRR